MTDADRAAELFEQGFNCSQAVFLAFAADLGLDRETALRLASGFGGGLGASGETCGAISGAIMAVGLKSGHVSPQDKEGKQRVYGLVNEFLKRFNADSGDILCRGLLGFDLGTPEGKKLAAERDTHHTVCPKFVRTAAALAGELLRR